MTGIHLNVNAEEKQEENHHLEGIDEDTESAHVTFRLSTGKLYGRNNEVARLRECYQSVWQNTNDCSEIILITGPSGTGKTALAFTLRDVVQQKGGYFIHGKFDQVHQTVTSHPIVSAFSDLTNLLIDSSTMKAGNDGIEDIQKRIRDATGGETSLLCDMIPALNKVFEKSTRQEDAVFDIYSLVRFRHLFCQFVSCMCSAHQPVLLFLDDLQWADKESLDLISALLTDASIDGLVLLGACRGNEVVLDSDLSVVLRSLEDNHDLRVHEIQLQNLQEDAICTMISDAFGVHFDSCRLLSSAICAQTSGNIFHTISLLESMNDVGALTIMENGHILQVDPDTLKLFRGTAAFDLILAKLKKLPGQSQKTLAAAACMGISFDLGLLRLCIDPNHVDDLFAWATLAGLVVDVSADSSRYRFRHDQIQAACYSLVTEAEKPMFCLSIGRKLWKALTKVDKVHEHCLLLTDLLGIGSDLIVDEAEKVATAELFFYTGKFLECSSRFRTAASIFETGRRLLPQRHWRDHYKLSMNIFNASMEVEQIISNFDELEALTKEVLKNGRSLHDKLQAYCSQICALRGKTRFDEALEVGLNVLDLLKVRLPRKAGPLRVFVSFWQTNRKLRRLMVSDILQMPLMTDPDVLAAMRVLNIMFGYAFSSGSSYSVLISITMVKLTLKHGLSAVSSTGFAFHSMMVAAVLEEAEDAYQYGQLALHLTKKFDMMKAWIPRVYLIVYGTTNLILMPMRDSIEPLLSAYKISLATGDTECGMMSLHMAVLCRLFGSNNIENLYSLCLQYRKIFAGCPHGTVIIMHDLLLQTLENLLGQSADALVLTGNFVDEQKMLYYVKQNNNRTCLSVLMFYKLMLAFILKDYVKAESVYDEFLAIRNGIAPSTRAFLAYAGGSSMLILARISGIKRRRRFIQGKRCLNYLREVARHCPENFMGQQYFVEAQMCLLHCQVDRALAKFQRAAVWAEHQGAWMELATVAEHMGMLLCEHGRMGDGLEHIRKARSTYLKWGAMVKVSNLESG